MKKMQKSKQIFIQQQINEVIQLLFNSQKRERDCVFCYELFMTGGYFPQNLILGRDAGQGTFFGFVVPLRVRSFLKKSPT